MTNILLVGEYFSNNLGDPLLCRTVESILQEEMRGVKIIHLDMSGKINMAEYYTVKRRSRLQKYLIKSSRYLDKIYRIFPTYRVLKNSWTRVMRIWAQLDELLRENTIDLVVFAGGELFMDYFAGVIYFVVRRAKDAKVIFHACGMHELSKDSIYVLRKTLRKKRVCSISLRDSYERFCKLFPVKNKTQETFDTALACSQWFQAAKEKEATYGVGIISKENAKELQKEIIRYFLTSGKSWKVITNGAKEDVAFAKQMFFELGVPKEKQEQFLHKVPQTAQELVEEVTRFEYIISFRMHSQIVAVSYGIPSFGFVWDTKIVEFYDKLNLRTNYAFLEDELNMNYIFEALRVDSNDLRSIAIEKGLQSKENLVQNVHKALGKKC